MSRWFNNDTLNHTVPVTPAAGERQWVEDECEDLSAPACPAR